MCNASLNIIIHYDSMSCPRQHNMFYVPSNSLWQCIQLSIFCAAEMTPPTDEDVAKAFVDCVGDACPIVSSMRAHVQNSLTLCNRSNVLNRVKHIWTVCWPIQRYRLSSLLKRFRWPLVTAEQFSLCKTEYSIVYANDHMAFSHAPSLTMDILHHPYWFWFSILRSAFSCEIAKCLIFRLGSYLRWNTLHAESNA